MGLPCPRLPVRQKRRIVPLEDGVDEVLCFLINFVLGFVDEDLIELEQFFLIVFALNDE